MARREAEAISERITLELYEEHAALRMLKAVATGCNEAANIDAAIQIVVNEVCVHTGWVVGHAYLLDREAGDLVSGGVWHVADEARFGAFRKATERTRLPRGVGLPGPALTTGRPAWITDLAAIDTTGPDIAGDPGVRRASVALQVGLRASFAFAVLCRQECAAVLEFFSPQPLEPDEAVLELMTHVGLQLARVIERTWSEQELARSGRRMEVILDSAGEGIYGVGTDGCATFVNAAAARMLDRPAAELVGQPIHDVLHPRTAGPACPLDAVMADLTRQHTAEDVFHRQDGTGFPVEYICTPLRYGEAEGAAVSGAVVTFNDITERKRFESQLRYLADHDPLTGLYNRRRFEAELTRQVAHDDRYAAAGAVLLLDLDHFKYINDALGHQAGDNVIRSVAALLRDRLRETDIVARLGGDEFVVLLPRADAAQAETVAADLARSIRQHLIEVGDRPLRVTTSIGVAPLRYRETTADGVLVEADVAMYQAKDSGRDRYAMYTAEAGQPAGITDRLTWIERIRRALDNDGFVLYWQPILDLAVNRVSHVELLLRMRTDDGTLVLPNSFLPAAERCGLIMEIDRWVVREAVRMLARQRNQGHDIETLIEINLSGRSVGDTELLTIIEKELESSGVPAHSLVFEITETAVIANMEQARHFALRLASIGCGLALDDFGAGFGSFYYLKHLPLAYLKIDGDFISNLPHSPVDQHMVKAMVEIASGLGMKTVAEFVGDRPTLALLRRLGVDYAQGYYIGRPGPAEQAQAWNARAWQPR